VYGNLYDIGVMEKDFSNLEFDLSISMKGTERPLPEEYWAVFSVLPAQVLGFMKSMELGLQPDSPSKSGAITRVVEGVTIYEYEKER
jgi:tagatose-6-phosphate ketose/aldose isomerase